jgi:ferredoxin
MLRSLFIEPRKKTKILATGKVVPAAGRCVQCGICSYNCPIGIDVRAHALRGIPVNDKHCLTCGECVARCPRGVLSFEKSEPQDWPGMAQRVENSVTSLLDWRAAALDAQATRPVSARS